jgi:hypothetical protein
MRTVSCADAGDAKQAKAMQAKAEQATASVRGFMPDIIFLLRFEFLGFKLTAEAPSWCGARPLRRRASIAMFSLQPPWSANIPEMRG